MNAPAPEDVARAQHEFWMIRLRRVGVNSRLAYWGEEFMVDWCGLSDRAKRYCMEGAEDYAAIIELLGYTIDIDHAGDQ